VKWRKAKAKGPHVPTATTTPKLGLISPTNTDQFSTADIANSMGVLDGSPGILPVANQAARPTTWTHLQHGRTIRQLDQGIDWWWDKVDSSATGTWRRTSSKGILYSQTNGSSVSSATTTYASGATVIDTPTVLIPGGRQIRVIVRWDTFGNSAGLAMGHYWEGSTLVNSWGVNGFDSTQSIWGQTGLAGHFMIVRNIAPTTQVNMTFKWAISAFVSGVGGTTYIRNTSLMVEEI
jgi:hypothetical protein